MALKKVQGHSSIRSVALSFKFLLREAKRLMATVAIAVIPLITLSDLSSRKMNNRGDIGSNATTNLYLIGPGITAVISSHILPAEGIIGRHAETPII